MGISTWIRQLFPSLFPAFPSSWKFGMAVDLGMGAASLPRVVAGGEEEPSQGNSQVLRDSGRRLKNGLGEAWDWWEGIFFWDWGEVGSEVPKLPAGIVGIASIWCSRDAIFHPVFPRFSPPGTPLQLHLLFPRLFQFLFHLHIHEKIKFCQIIRGFLASEGALEWRGGLQANPAPFHPSLELPGFFWDTGILLEKPAWRGGIFPGFNRAGWE